MIAIESPPAIVQSFDCRKAASAVEKMVCTDPELAKLDEEMARAFDEARRRDGTVTGQQTWLRKRNACAEPACVKQSYTERIAYLKGELAGEWNREGSTSRYRASLTITNVTLSSFDFHLFGSSGAHIGEIEGTAARKGSAATYLDPELKCAVTFRRRAERLVVTTSPQCSGMAGMGVTFEGVFGLDLPDAPMPTLTELNILAAGVTEQAFSALTGQSYQAFLDTFDLIYEEEDLDRLGVKVRSGGVRGRQGEEGAIVMSRPDGKIYAAVIDGDVIKYFSNDPIWKSKLPPTVQRWREELPGFEIVFASAPRQPVLLSFAPRSSVIYRTVHRLR